MGYNPVPEHGVMDEPWTADRVKRELVAAFRKAPSLPVISASKGELLTGIDEDHVAEWDLLAASYHCLGCDATERERESRLMLLTWARVMALAKEGAAEASLRAICAERSWDWKAFQRRVAAAAERMATTLNVAANVARSTARMR
jgi:hypothetical protein